MHENREISSTPLSNDQGRSAKAINHNADVYVPEKSHCAVVPVNQPNKEAEASAEAGEGRAQMKENTGKGITSLRRKRNILTSRNICQVCFFEDPGTPARCGARRITPQGT